MPIGRSHYDALQVVFKQQAQHPVPGITSSNFQVSYNLSRIVATTTSSDEFFSPGVLDNDNPALFMGRSALDHTNQISFGGSAILKYGPRIALLAHFFSASPSTMTLDTTSLANGQIFQSDLTGDGITGDPAPGTVAGTYMHGVKPTNLGAFITNYNNTVANTLTPAGKAVAASGLITQAQLIREVWGPTHPADFRSLRVCISNLRSKLEPLPHRPKYLITEAGLGYRLRQD